MKKPEGLKKKPKGQQHKMKREGGLRGWVCSPSMYLSRDQPPSPRTMRDATRFTTKRGPIRPLPSAISEAQARLWDQENGADQWRFWFSPSFFGLLAQKNKKITQQWAADPKAVICREGNPEESCFEDVISWTALMDIAPNAQSSPHALSLNWRWHCRFCAMILDTCLACTKHTLFRLPCSDKFWHWTNASHSSGCIF